jgi:hypothetical protein
MCAGFYEMSALFITLNGEGFEMATLTDQQL